MSSHDLPAAAAATGGSTGRPPTGSRRAARSSRGPAPPNPSRKTNNVQVGHQRSNFVFADLTKHLLAGGEPDVEVSALGAVISDAVAVVEMLKNQGMVVVTKIETSRGMEDAARRDTTDKISIWVTKSASFDEKYAQQMRERRHGVDSTTVCAAAATGASEE